MGHVRKDSEAENPPNSPALSRRALLGAGAAALAVTAVQWTPLGRVAAASADTTVPAPPQFPSGIPLYQQTFQNWSGEVAVEGLWSASPESAADVRKMLAETMAGAFSSHSAHPQFAHRAGSPSAGCSLVVGSASAHADITLPATAELGAVSRRMIARGEFVAG